MKPTQIENLEAARKNIFAINLDRILDKLTRRDTLLTGIDKPWSKTKALEAIELYKRYLWVVVKYREEYPFLPPSREIDAIWHAHILDTRQYHKDCEAIFGTYHHHDPYFGLNGPMDEKHLHDSFNSTQKLYFEEFGDYIYEIEDAVGGDGYET